MRIRQLVVALLLATVVLTPGQRDAADAAEITTGQAEATFHSLINSTRAAHGLAPLSVDGQLVGQARSWSQTMAADGVLRHAGDLSGGIAADWEVLGENVGTHDVIDVNRLHQAFVASPAHLANIVDARYDRMGVGVVFDAQGRIWTTHRFMAVRGEDTTTTTSAAPTTTTAPPTTTTTRPPATTTTAHPTTTAPQTTAPPTTTAAPTTSPPTTVPATTTTAPPTTVPATTTTVPTTARETTTRATAAPTAVLVPLTTTTVPASVFSQPPTTASTTVATTGPPSAPVPGVDTTPSAAAASSTAAGDTAPSTTGRPFAAPTEATLVSGLPSSPASNPASTASAPTANDPAAAPGAIEPGDDSDETAPATDAPHSPRQRYAVQVDGRSRPVPTFYSFLLAWWLGSTPGLDAEFSRGRHHDTAADVQGEGGTPAETAVEANGIRNLLEQLRG